MKKNSPTPLNFRKKLIKLLTILYFSSTTFTLCGAGWGSSPVNHQPDCGKCPKINEDIGNYKKSAHRLGIELEKQRNAVKALSPDQDSKRMQLTSHLFVLAAKQETAENKLLASQKELDFNCHHCSKKE